MAPYTYYPRVTWQVMIIVFLIASIVLAFRVARRKQPVRQRERFLYVSLLCAALWSGLFFSHGISHALGLRNAFEGLALLLLMNPIGWLLTLVLIVSLIFLTGYHLSIGPNTIRIRLLIWYALPLAGFALEGHTPPHLSALADIALIALAGLLPLVWLTVSRDPSAMAAHRSMSR